MRKVLVTGATGFTGSHVIPLLIEQGIAVRCFVRPSSDLRNLPASQVEVVRGDLDNVDSLASALLGTDGLVNIASLGFGHAPNILAALQKAAVHRAVFVSTTGIFTQLNAPSKTVRLAAEKVIQESGLQYTILRPTMIYGTSRDRNMCRLIQFLKRWPVIPVLGSGEFLQQPVYVKDLAFAITRGIQTPAAIEKAYNISGGSALTYNQVIDATSAALQRRVRKIHLPAGFLITTLKVPEKYGLRFPIKAEQIQRLNEHKTFSFEDAAKDLEYRPRTFEDGIRLEVEGMKLI